MTDAKTPRPAEEVARNMVTLQLAELELVIEDDQEAAAVACRRNCGIGTREKIVRIVARAITRAREEGAASALAGQQPGAATPTPEALASAALDVALDRVDIPDVWRDDVAAELTRRFQEMAAQPRDIAGRIRALVQEYAWLWSNADEADLDEAYHDVAKRLVQAAACARRGEPIEPLIRLMRESSSMMDAHVVGPKWPEILRKAADELEAIVRESGEQR